MKDNLAFKKLNNEFFNRDALIVARELVGKVLCHFYDGIWLQAMIIETEAYYKDEKGSHSSLGFTQKRKALFMPAGTIYMYYARGKDSFNISVEGEGNAVLLKSGIPYIDNLSKESAKEMLDKMHQLNPSIVGNNRLQERLCSGQTLLARSLGLKVTDWDQKVFNERLFIADLGYSPNDIIQTTRLGIPLGRDEHLLYRFVDAKYRKFCTKNPIIK